MLRAPKPDHALERRRRSGDLDVGEPLQENFKRDSELQSGKRGTQTVVDAAPEGEMALVGRVKSSSSGLSNLSGSWLASTGNGSAKSDIKLKALASAT